MKSSIGLEQILMSLLKCIRHMRPINLSNRLCTSGALWCGTVLSLVGCYNRPGRVAGIELDAPAVCSSIFAQQDANEDNLLSAEELVPLPPLESCLKKMDTNGDGNVSREELEAHFAKVFNPEYGMLAASCRVTNNGKPLGGAVVHFIPPDYLQLDRSIMPIASGMTSPHGVAQMEIHPDYLPPDVPKVRGMVRPGFYLVEVTKEGVDIPARYNLETTLGVEVSPETTIGGPINVQLKF